MQAMTERRTISDFRAVHPGEPVFLLASGPSLSRHDLTPLDERRVMGMNRSTLLYDRARYHCAMDPGLFRRNPELLRKAPVLFTFPGRPFGIPIRQLDHRGERFSFDLEEGIYSGWTISYFTLQVAVWLGFTRIYFLGLDLTHTAEGSHFFGRDRPRVDREQLRIFPEMRRALAAAAAALEGTGVEVYNCSPITDFDAFPRVAYEEALARTAPAVRPG
ncbi:MAG: hypothetical protein R3325_01870 [Thermoanaerobaculia bacterium]|nr:hypothetical protein [Thermoanaerobaculia bacterium]